MKPQPRSIPTYESKTFAAIVEGGDGDRKLRILAAPYYRTFLNRLPVGSQVTLSVTDKKPKRTEAQNRYYHLYLSEIARETGNDHDALHELFKAKFLPNRVKEVLGEEVEIRGSTTQLTRLEFGEYIDRIAELTGIEPPPLESVRGL